MKHILEFFQGKHYIKLERTVMVEYRIENPPELVQRLAYEFSGFCLTSIIENDVVQLSFYRETSHDLVVSLQFEDELEKLGYRQLGKVYGGDTE